jgi:hypothetical protein
MSALPKAPLPNPCPFCGVVIGAPHETQEGCIAALHTEIGRVRGILAHLRPTGVLRPVEEPDEQPAATIRIALD